MELKSLLLTPRGRIGRGAFWIGFAIVMVLSLVLNMIPGVVGHLLGFVLLWPQVCVHAKRLHDMGRTAWWMLVPAVVLLVCGAATYVLAFSETGHGGSAATVPLAVAIVCGVGFLLWVGLTPVSSQSNRFGAQLQGAGG